MADQDIEIKLITNAAPFNGAAWELIAPYGEFPTGDRKKIQKFGKAQGDLMVANFNTARNRLGKLFRGVPIYHGHPDVDPKSWPDDRRLGKIIELAAREGGLWGKPEYNALGEQNKTEGWWAFPSPAWLYPRTADSTIFPDELLSIGLVNTPNITVSAPWVNSSGGIHDRRLHIGGRLVSFSTERERSAAVLAEVNCRMKADRCSYDAAYKAVKRDPQFKRIFEAMKQPG